MFGPLKTYFSQACDVFMVNNPGETIGDKNIGEIFCQAYLKAATAGADIKAFQKCGTEPYDPSVFKIRTSRPQGTKPNNTSTFQSFHPLLRANKLMHKTM
ncbi:hypothetical protein QE152_g34398 [Popillia japonica]|uniref:Uncharacterized protein n=1 Tax=Popillia japonica TaxID=7064 RepID=A0AAW1IT82_POPJA